MVVVDVVADELEIPAGEILSPIKFPYPDFNTHVPRRLGTKGEILLRSIPPTRTYLGLPTPFHRLLLTETSIALTSHSLIDT